MVKRKLKNVSQFRARVMFGNSNQAVFILIKAEFLFQISSVFFDKAVFHSISLHVTVG